MRLLPWCGQCTRWQTARSPEPGAVFKYWAHFRDLGRDRDQFVNTRIELAEVSWQRSRVSCW